MKEKIKKVFVNLLVMSVLALGMYIHTIKTVSHMEKEMMESKISQLNQEVEMLKK